MQHGGSLLYAAMSLMSSHDKPPRYHWGVKRCLLHDGFFLLPSCGRCLKQRMELTF